MRSVFPLRLSILWRPLLRVFCILSVLYASESCTAQQPGIRYFPSTDGLPGGRTYHLHEDRSGYLWATTRSSISRFDGVGFRNFCLEQRDILKTGAFRMHEDQQGRIWIIPFDGKLVYYQNDKIHRPNFLKGIEKENVCWVTEATNGTLYFSTRGGELIVYRKDGAQDKIKFGALPGYELCVLSDSIVLVTNENAVLAVNVYTRKVSTVIDKWQNFFMIQKFIRFHKTPSGKVLVSLSKNIVEVREDLSVVNFIPYSNLGIQPEILNIYSENDSVMWIPSTDGVSRILYRANKVLHTEKFLSAIHVNSVLKDRRDNIWLATSYGLMSIKTLSVRYLSSKDGLFDRPVNFIIGSKKGELIMGTELGTFYKYSEGKLELLLQKSDYITNKVEMENDTIACNGQLGSIYFTANSVCRRAGDPRFFSKSPSGKRYYIYPTFQKIEEVGAKEIRMPMSVSVSSFVALNDTDFWLGSLGSLYRFNRSSMREPGPGLPNDNIKAMKRDRYNNLWIATNGYGVFCYRNGKTIQLKGKEHGITDAHCNSIYLDSGGDVWLCNNEGLNWIKLDKKGEIASITTFNKKNAFQTGEVHDVLRIGNLVYAGTNDGLAIIDLNTFRDKTSAVPLLISGVYLNNRLFDHATQKEFSHNQNAVEINYNILNLGEGDVMYQYRLLPNIKRWTNTKHNRARFEALPPGKYTFELTGSVEGEHLKKILSYSFTILPPVWTKPVFYIPFILLALGIVLLLIRARINQERRKVEVQRNLIESELKVLRLQMNPHFLFNTLQSIQDFVIQKQGNEALHYLSRFSKLVRMILNHSKRSFITLEEELAFIDHYVELERMRNPGEIIFNRQISPSLNTQELQVPAMIIQPFVENCFKHALGRNKGNTLTLKLDETESLICLQIEDNGPGFGKPDTERNHDSSGIAITVERIKRLSEVNESFDPVLIEDLAASGKGKGTRVSIYLKKISL